MFEVKGENEFSISWSRVACLLKTTFVVLIFPNRREKKDQTSHIKILLYFTCMDGKWLALIVAMDETNIAIIVTKCWTNIGSNGWD